MKYKDTLEINQQKPTGGKRGPVYGEKGSDRGLLGTNAKSLHTKSNENAISKGLGSNCLDTVYTHTDYETGELIPFKKNKFGELVENVSTDKIITERFLLQCSARRLMPLSRTAKCNRLSQKYCDDVGVLKSVEFNSISFSGLQTCGSPWACTVCAAKISERRKNEVVDSLDSWLQFGGITYFLTFTFRHSKNEVLSELREKQRHALQLLRNSRAYGKYKKLIGYSGLIRALEVTWGQSNGWHPHTHEIVFAQNKTSFQSIKRLLFPAWQNACKKAGLAAPSFRRGIDVQGGDKAGAYLSKYGDELTKGHMKKASGDRFSPFDLLRSYHHDKNELHGKKFIEFAEGMQGSRQLYWTNGLKDFFGISDKSDEVLATESLEERILMGYIPHQHWRAIVKYEGRATVRILGRDHGLQAVIDLAAEHYNRYVESGDKQKDDDRIAKNRLKYAPVPESKKPHLTEVQPQLDIFERINQKIDEDKARLESPVNHDLDNFVVDLTRKLVARSEQNDFEKEHYSKIEKDKGDNKKMFSNPHRQTYF